MAPVKTWDELYPEVQPLAAEDFREVIAQTFTRPDLMERLLSKRTDLVVRPTEMAVLVENGEIREVLTQQRLEKFGKGFVDILKGWFGKNPHASLTFIKRTPFDLVFPVRASTRDSSPVKGAMTIRLQATEDGASRLLGLISGKKVLNTGHLVDQFANEATAFVVGAHGADYDADQFKGNVDMHKDLDSRARVELGKTFSTYGLNVVRAWTNWEPTEYEQLLEQQNVLMMEQAREDVESWASEYGKDRELSEDLAEVARETRRKRSQILGDFDTHLHKLEAKWGLEVADVQGEERAKMQQLLGSLQRERIQFDEAARRRREEFALDMGERKARFQQQLGEARAKKDLEMEELSDLVDLKERMGQQKVARLKGEAEARIHEYQGTELAKDAQDAAHKQTQMEQTQRTLQETIANINASDMSPEEKSAAIQRAMQEFTRMTALGQGEGGIFEAERERARLETYQEAQREERQDQRAQVEDMAKLMEAGKQPTHFVQGSGPFIGGTHSHSQGDGRRCQSCGRQMGEDARFCTQCGFDHERSEGKE